jgi:magnesium-transporting ATPase (P-type)
MPTSKTNSIALIEHVQLKRLTRIALVLSSLALVPAFIALPFAVYGIVAISYLILDAVSRGNVLRLLGGLAFVVTLVALYWTGYRLHRAVGRELKAERFSSNLWRASFAYNSVVIVFMVWLCYEIVRRSEGLAIEGWQWLYVLLPVVVSLWTGVVALLSLMIWRKV